MSPTPTNPTTTPIDCAEPGCTWAVRGVPDKYARIMARDHAAEHAGQASSTATETAVDRVPLRDRIRRAVCEAEGFAWDTDMLEPDEYGEVADAVLAVLPAPAADLPAVLREAADDLTALAAPDSERGAGVRWAADHLRHKADQVDTGGDDEVDDTLHACPGRWAGPDCRCFDADTVEQPDEQPLTAAQREYVTAQYDLFQLAAHGHYTYAPLHDRKTGAYLSTQQIKAGQQDYNDRLRAAQARSEAATIRAAADWLRTEYPGPDLDAHIRRAADALDRYAALAAS
ncbi:hypothetical protein ABTX84_19290 [Streptomyces sp. NPDC095614]|uniref:hypothetical protein n=1 Tax=Streptomyces sp. NPDC095614 TaxID=3156692 RepID=UPI00332D170B